MRPFAAVASYLGKVASPRGDILAAERLICRQPPFTRYSDGMNAFPTEYHFPRLMRGIGRALNKYGDGVMFRAVSRTPPIPANPHAETGIHTAVPHRYLFAYLTAIKSFLRYHADIAVYVHDDGSLREEDKALIRAHVPGAHIVDRAWADQAFADRVGDEFLMKVRRSYTSYLKLFDPTLVSPHKRIAIVDTDVLFLSHPAAIVEWARNGGAAWYHRSGSWIKKTAPQGTAPGGAPQPNAAHPTHIQQLVIQQIPQINAALRKQFAFVHGFNSGFIGYDHGMVD